VLAIYLFLLLYCSKLKFLAQRPGDFGFRLRILSLLQFYREFLRGQETSLFDELHDCRLGLEAEEPQERQPIAGRDLAPSFDAHYLLAQRLHRSTRAGLLVSRIPAPRAIGFAVSAGKLIKSRHHLIELNGNWLTQFVRDRPATAGNHFAIVDKQMKL